MRLEVDFHDLAIAPGFQYLATPYSLYEDGLQAAWLEACRIAGGLMKQGVAVYSPIAELHPIAIAAGINPLDGDFWIEGLGPKMAAAHSLIVARMKGWNQSRGVNIEINTFRKAGKPVVFLDP